jgi:hypothetical protein
VNDAARVLRRPWIAQIARASAWALVAFCAIEVGLVRGGRAAATLLVTVDSGLLELLEDAGSGIGGIAARGILASAALALVARLLAAPPAAPRRLRLGALIAAGATAWVVARGAAEPPGARWWPAAVVAATALVTLATWRPRCETASAVLLQAGLLAYATWALAASSGGVPWPWLDRVSEVAILGGAAGVGLASGSPSAARVVSAAAACAAVAVAGIAFPDVFHAVLRHVSGFGWSGLPRPLLTALAAAAAAGLAVSASSLRSFVPLAAILVCARRPGAELVAALTAATGLLLLESGTRRQAAA